MRSRPKSQPGHEGKMNDPNEIETDPTTMYADLCEKQYKAELELLDRFLLFSAELVRISLLGIAVFGFLIKEVFFDQAGNPISKPSIWLSALGVLALAVSAALALAHRYYATDAFRYYLYGLRTLSIDATDEKPKERAQRLERTRVHLSKRDSWLARCIWFKILSVASLALGAVLIALAFAVILWGAS